MSLTIRMKIATRPSSVPVAWRYLRFEDDRRHWNFESWRN